MNKFDFDKAKGMTTEQIRDAADALKAIVGNHRITGNEWCEIQKEVERKTTVVIKAQNGVSEYQFGSECLSRKLVALVSAGVEFSVEYK